MQYGSTVTPPEAIPEEQLVGAHFGIVEDLARVRPDSDDLPLRVYAARLADLSAFCACAVPREASGAGLSEAAGKSACLGEAVERYAAALPAPGAIRQARRRDLEGAVSPDKFALFRSEQYHRRNFPFRPWHADDRLGWVEGESLENHQPVWVPAAFVYQPYLPAADEPTLAPSISTGLACGRTRTEALRAGLCEVIERDAVSLAWLSQIVPARVIVPDFSPDSESAQLVTLLAKIGLRWGVFQLTTDLKVPVFAALVEGNSSLGNIVSFGSASHPDPQRAWQKALIEAAHGRMYVKSLIRRKPDWKAGRKFQFVTSFEDHARFYSTHPEHRHVLDRWWQTESTLNLDLISADPLSNDDWLLKQVELLNSAGYQVIACDLTTPDIASVGLHVVRVLVPGLQPLHGHHQWPHLGGKRLQQISEIFGPHVRPSTGINPYPHPCP